MQSLMEETPVWLHLPWQIEMEQFALLSEIEQGKNYKEFYSNDKRLKQGIIS